MPHDPAQPLPHRIYSGSLTRGSTTTPSGSMDKFRQGVSIQTNQQKYAGTVWTMTSNSSDRTIIASEPLKREKTPDERYMPELRDLGPYDDTIDFEFGIIPDDDFSYVDWVDTTVGKAYAYITLDQKEPIEGYGDDYGILNIAQVAIDITSYDTLGHKIRKVYTQSPWTLAGNGQVFAGDESGWNWTAGSISYLTCQSIVQAINRVHTGPFLPPDEDYSGGVVPGDPPPGHFGGHGTQMNTPLGGGIKAYVDPPGGNRIVLESDGTGANVGGYTISITATGGIGGQGLIHPTGVVIPGVWYGPGDTSGFTLKNFERIVPNNTPRLIIGTNGGRIKEIPNHLMEVRDFGNPLEYRHDIVFKDNQIDLTVSGSYLPEHAPVLKGTGVGSEAWSGQVPASWGPMFYLLDDPDPEALSEIKETQNTPVMGQPTPVYPEGQLNLLHPTLNRLDGIIEPMIIRRAITHNTIEHPHPAYGIQCSMTTLAEDNQGRGVVMCQEIDLNDNTASPFLDMSQINNNTLTTISGSFEAGEQGDMTVYAQSVLSDDYSVVNPYDDSIHEELILAAAVNDRDIRTALIHMSGTIVSVTDPGPINGTSYNETIEIGLFGRFITSEMKSALYSAGTGTTTSGERLRLEHKSATAGYTYGSDHPNGTDSIAFGGLKR